MPYIEYVPKNFRGSSLAVISQARDIIQEYQAQGFVLTLRQLYYQFVARDLIDNTQRSYKRLGTIIADARLAGLIDWDAMEDRTRNLHKLPTWSGPAAMIQSAQGWYRENVWRTQPYHVEVWVEKEALAGVFQRVCDELRVPLFSCRGYVSLSEMHVAAQRLERVTQAGHTPVILHFGDHDPSGIDMTRDIYDRIQDTFWVDFQLKRLALNMSQVDEYGPPPNPAKLTDSRSTGYVQKYGFQSWELDALDPTVLASLVRDAVDGLVDQDAMDEALGQEAEADRLLGRVERHWAAVAAFVDNIPDED